LVWFTGRREGVISGGLDARWLRVPRLAVLGFDAHCLSQQQRQDWKYATP
jgi:hypothetical protein